MQGRQPNTCDENGARSPNYLPPAPQLTFRKLVSARRDHLPRVRAEVCRAPAALRRAAACVFQACPRVTEYRLLRVFNPATATPLLLQHDEPSRKELCVRRVCTACVRRVYRVCTACVLRMSPEEAIATDRTEANGAGTDPGPILHAQKIIRFFVGKHSAPRHAPFSCAYPRLEHACNNGVARPGARINAALQAPGKRRVSLPHTSAQGLWNVEVS